MAVAKAGAQEASLPLYRYLGGVNATVLPMPLMNILMVAPMPITKSISRIHDRSHWRFHFQQGPRWGVEIFHTLKTVLKKKGYSTNVGDEGGFAPDIQSNEEAIETVLEAIVAAGYKPGEDIGIAMDAASTEMFDEKKNPYKLYKSSGKPSAVMRRYWPNR